jgi:hypothetical protein
MLNKDPLQTRFNPYTPKVPDIQSDKLGQHPTLSAETDHAPPFCHTSKNQSLEILYQSGNNKN